MKGFVEHEHDHEHALILEVAHVLAEVKADIKNEAAHFVHKELFSGGEALVDKLWFRAAITGAILANALLISFEVDRDIELGSFKEVCNYTFTSIWILEAMAKICLKGCSQYFSDGWNRMDFVLALISLIDSSVIILTSLHELDLNILTVLRILKMVRLVRVLRVLHFFEELWLLVAGMLNASKLIFWVVILIILVCYVGGLFMTLVVGGHCREGETYSDFQDCFTMFGTLPRSMYTLFQVMTFESWSMAVARPVIEEKPYLILFFGMFLYITSFGLLNVFTGIIVDQTLSNAAAQRDLQVQEKTKAEEREIKLLKSVFKAADLEGTGSVYVNDFVRACKQRTVQHTFDMLGISVSREALARRFFDVLDSDGDGHIEVEDFLGRILIVKEEGRKMLQDETQMLIDVRHLHRRMDKLETGILEQLDGIKQQLAALTVKQQLTPLTVV